MRHIIKTLPLMILFAIALSAVSPRTLSAKATHGAWLSTVTQTPSGSHIIGNPQAQTKIVEYMSYTCPHCARFEIDDAPMLKQKYLVNGQASFELRNMLINAVDLTVAMLAQCGDPKIFFDNHHKLLAAQNIWLPKAQNISAATREKLKAGDITGYMTGTYDELQLQDIMTSNGVTAKQAKACLADKTVLDQIFAMTKDGGERGVNSTPSFMINEKLAENVHTLSALTPLLPSN